MASLKGGTSEMVQELLTLISKPNHKREDREIGLVLPWLCKRSQLLQHQSKSVLHDIVKNCTLLSVFEDDVIIKQGDRGDSFYVILRGSASVYIDPRMTGEGAQSEDALSRISDGKKKNKQKPKPLDSEASVLSGMEKPGEDSETVTDADGTASMIPDEDELEDDESDGTKKPQKLLAPLDRSKFGKFIMKYGPGSAFGEIALVNKESFRNATIITDEPADLMVIDQELFDRSLRAQQEEKYAEVRTFVDEHPFFKDMNQKFKKLLEMSIRKEKYIFDTYIIKQGDPVEGLHFITSGSANISIQPKKHQQQYPHLWPFEAGVDQIAIEFEHLREARKAAILRKYEDPSVWETKPEELVIRREQGYAAIEKKMKENHINLCSVQSKEVLGDVEMLVNLGTYMQTVRCTSDTTCFILDTKNFDRLISNKKNVSQTMNVMREYVKSKLHTRMQMRQADLIPLLGYLYQKLSEQTLPQAKKPEPFKTSKTLPDEDEEMQHLLQYFREGKEVVLIKPSIPGLVYYKELMRDKANARKEQQRRVSKAGDNIKLGSVYKARPKRQPRSMLQIRESLKQMMEAELIEMENKKFRKKQLKQQRKEQQAKDLQEDKFSKRVKSPKTLIGMSNSKQKKETSKPGLIEVMRAAAEKKEQEATNSAKTTPRSDIESSPANKLASNPNLPKSIPPVFVTEVSKGDLKLPVIREENTQEEIVVNGGSESKTVKSSAQKDSPKDSGRNNEAKQAHDVPDAIIIDPPSSRKKKKVGSGKKKSPTPRENGQMENNNGQENENDDINLNASVPNLPNIGNNEQDAETTENTDKSAPWQTAIKFVNQRIQERLTKSLLDDESPYRDFESSEPSLKLLETRIQAFHIKYGMGNKTKNLPQLRRFKLDNQEEYGTPRPKPGGRVWVKRQACKFSDSEYLVKDHKHIRYKMVDSIPDFDKVYKSRVVVHEMLRQADLT